MTPAEQSARAYCHSIGADPDEIVWGGGRLRDRICKPRWCWYVGAKIEHKHAAE